MNKRKFQVSRFYRFDRPVYQITCNGLSVLECHAESLTLANKIMGFLKSECQDVPLWFEEGRYNDIINQKVTKESG